MFLGDGRKLSGDLFEGNQRLEARKMGSELPPLLIP
jgi:hypothetical protein